MFAILGCVVIFLAVIGGFVLEEGNPMLMIQPVEMLIILGVSFGAFLISNPLSITMNAMKSVPRVFIYKYKSKQEYLNLLTLLYSFFVKMKRDGQIAIEADIENPQKSELFKPFSTILADHHLLTFLCDNLKVIVSTNLTTYELDDLMDKDIDMHHREATETAHSVARMADGLPGIGIVAAVMGIVLTMGKIDQPPEVIGHCVAVAMLGTFFGILMCYGFIGPIAVNMEHISKDELSFLTVIKQGIVSFIGGAEPMMAAEFARRNIPVTVKPSFVELESSLKAKDATSKGKGK